MAGRLSLEQLGVGSNPTSAATLGNHLVAGCEVLALVGLVRIQVPHLTIPADVMATCVAVNHEF